MLLLNFLIKFVHRRINTFFNPAKNRVTRPSNSFINNGPLCATSTACLATSAALARPADDQTLWLLYSNTKVVTAVAQVRQVAESNSLRTGELDQVVEDLSQQTAALEDEVGAFKA